MTGTIESKEAYKDIHISTGSLAQVLKVHQRTLRIYDKQGILTPSRTAGDRRSYTLSDLEKAKFVLFLSHNLGINLAGIKFILAILEKDKIKPEYYFKYLNDIADDLKINANIQNDNILKNSKRGRPKK